MQGFAGGSKSGNIQMLYHRLFNQLRLQREGLRGRRRPLGGLRHFPAGKKGCQLATSFEGLWTGLVQGIGDVLHCGVPTQATWPTGIAACASLAVFADPRPTMAVDGGSVFIPFDRLIIDHR